MKRTEYAVKMVGIHLLACEGEQMLHVSEKRAKLPQGRPGWLSSATRGGCTALHRGSAAPQREKRRPSAAWVSGQREGKAAERQDFCEIGFL